MLETQLKALETELKSAQNELVQAETALVELTAAAETARESVSRLKTAVAVLSGESAPAEPPELPPSSERSSTGGISESVSAARDVENAQGEGVGNRSEATNTVPGADATDAEIDEWERNRKKKLRQREKERMAENPLADIKCTGCGQKGHLQQSVIQAPSGMPLQAIVCTSCGNQTFA